MASIWDNFDAAQKTRSIWDDFYAQARKRTTGEAISDVAVSAAGGVGSVIEGAGTLYGLASGDMDNALREFGRGVSEYWQSKKSPGLIAREQQRERAIDSAESEWGKAWAAVRETATDPGLFSSFLAEQLPMLIPGMAVGRAAGVGAAALGAGEKVARGAAMGAGIGTFAAQQGADVGGGAYERIKALPDEMFRANPAFQALVSVGYDEEKAKEAVAIDEARASSLLSGGLSLASMLVPGGTTVERLLVGAGMKRPVALGIVKGILGEAAQEAIEEGGGRAIENLGVRAVDPRQSVTEGVGEAAGLGALMGGVFGGGAAALTRHDRPEDAQARLEDARTAQAVAEVQAAPTVDAAVGAALAAIQDRQNAIFESDILESVAGQGLISGAMERAVDRAAAFTPSPVFESDVAESLAAGVVPEAGADAPRIFRDVLEEPAYQQLEARKQAELDAMEFERRRAADAREAELRRLREEDAARTNRDVLAERVARVGGTGIIARAMRRATGLPEEDMEHARWGRTILERMEELERKKGGADAVQESGAAPLDVREQSEDGETLGARDAEGQEAAGAQGDRRQGDEGAVLEPEGGRTTPEIVAGLPAPKERLFVEWGNRRVEVESLEDASRKWDAFRSESGAGVSEIGGARIVDQTGKEVARIAYNGKVWPPGEWKPGMRPLVGKTFEEQRAEAEKTIDAGAHEAAVSPQNDYKEPTKAQIIAGNAKLGHERIGSTEYSFENPDGSIREDKNNDPPKWRTKMQGVHYGYARGTVGYDKDHVDVFVKTGTPKGWDGTVFVVNQNKVGSKDFDEHKAMIGFDSQQEAIEAYLAHYEKGWEKNIRSVVPMSYRAFEAWAKSKGKSGPKGGPAEPITILGKPVEQHTKKQLEMAARSARTLVQRAAAQAELDRRERETQQTEEDLRRKEEQAATGQVEEQTPLTGQENDTLLSPPAGQRKFVVPGAQDMNDEGKTVDVVAERGQWEFQSFEERKKLEEYVDSRGEDRVRWVADWDNSEVSAGSGQHIVNIYWLKHKERGEVKPFGQDTAHIALGVRKDRADKIARDFLAQQQAEERNAKGWLDDAIKHATPTAEEQQEKFQKLSDDSLARNGRWRTIAPPSERALLEKDGQFISLHLPPGQESTGPIRYAERLGWQRREWPSTQRPELELTQQTEEDLRRKEEQAATGQVEEQTAAVRDRDTAVLTSPEGTAPPRSAEEARVPTQQQGLFAAAQALRSAAEAIEKATQPSEGKITDVGEKIGGARKDTSVKTGPRKSTVEPEDPGWRRRYQVTQIVGSRRPEEVGRWVIHDTRSKDWAGRPKQVGRDTYPTKEAAEAMVPILAVARNHSISYRTVDGATKYVIVRNVTDRKRVQVVEQAFDSREDAERYMAEHAVEIIETRTSFGEEILPRPDKVMRIGKKRRDGNVTGQDFLDTFGFRGVEFGNWQAQDERQTVMNHAYDAFMDLAEVLNIPPRAIGMDGELGLAFGARGHGLTGARAHYEIDYGVINLTKMKGAGALAHEWFHALDHYFGRQDTKASSERVVNKRGDKVFKTSADASRDMASHGFSYRSGVREELRAVYKELLDTMMRKAEKFVEDTKRAERFVSEARGDVERQLKAIRENLAEKYPYGRKQEPATGEQLAAFDTLAQKIIDGEALTVESRKNAASRSILGYRQSNDVLDQLSAIYKAVRGRSGWDSTNRNGIFDRLSNAMQLYATRLKMLQDASTGTEKTKMVPTSFAMESRAIDQGRASDYWSTPHEMAARAFEAFVHDKIAEKGDRSDFLAYGTIGAVPTPWGWKRPYPEGEERKAINAVFDKFVGVLKTRETERGVAMFSRQAENIDKFKMQIARDSNDLPVYANAEIVIARGKTERTFAILDDDGRPIGRARTVTFKIFDRLDKSANGKAPHIGYLRSDVDEADGRILNIQLIELKPHLQQTGRGFGETVVASILATNPPSSELDIIDIVVDPDEEVIPGKPRRDARGFWKKMGTTFKNWSNDPNVQMDGVLSKGHYLKARGEGGRLLRGNEASEDLERQDRVRPGGERQGEGGASSAARASDQAGRGGGQEGARGSRSAAPAAVARKAAVRRLVEPVLEKWENAPEVRIIGSMAEAPERVRIQDEEARAAGATGAPEAFWYGGAVYLVADQLDTPASVYQALFHEVLGHDGLRGTFGERLDQVLDEVARSFAGRVREKARAYGMDFNNVNERRQAAEEVLAELAQTMPRAGVVRRLIAAIRQFLRDIGIDLKLSENDVIVNFILPARAFIEGRSAGAGVAAAPAFQREAPWYYSSLERKLRDLKQGAAPVAQWKATIKALKGVSKDEIEWSGINEWLDLQQGKVTKEAVLDYLAQNGVRVSETVLGDAGSATHEYDSLKVELDALGYDVVQDMDVNLNTGDILIGITHRATQTYYPFESGVGFVEDEKSPLPERVREIGRRMDELEYEMPGSDIDGEPRSTRYRQYTIPGGQNYRELLLTLPIRKAQRVDSMTREELARWYEQEVGYDPTEDDPSITTEDLREMVRGYDAEIGASDAPTVTSEFRSTHFSQPNILAHVRFNERTDVEGKRVLFIEELQSDWAQKGKRQGFEGNAEQRAADQAVQEAADRLERAQQALEATGLRWGGDRTTWAVYTSSGERAVPMHTVQVKPGKWAVVPFEDALTRQTALSFDLFDSPEAAWNNAYRGNQPVAMTQQQYDAWRELQDAHREVGVAQVRKLNAGSAVPRAPFVEKTEAWVTLALKRMIRWAAENGFDRVAWTTGEQQTERYDLSKHVDAISYDRNDDGTYDLSIWKGKSTYNDYNRSLKGIAPEKLDDIVGKEVAQRIRDGAGTPMADLGYMDYSDASRPKPSGGKMLSGLDLKVGGEGMRTFYDRIVPNVANDLLKKLGGGRVGTLSIWNDGARTDNPEIEISGDEESGYSLSSEGAALPGEFDSLAAAQAERTRIMRSDGGTLDQPGFDITPEMREAALRGLPLFSRAPAPDTEAFKRWFGESKVVSRSAAATSGTAPRGRSAWIDAEPAETQEALRKAGVWYTPPTLKERVAEWRKDWAKRVEQGLFDQFSPIKEYDYKAYMLARMTRGADAALEAVLNYGTIKLDNDGAVNVDFEGGGFLKVMQGLKGEHERFLAWVIGNRADRLKAEGREHNFTDEDIRRLKALNQGKMADGTARAQAYAKARMELDRYNRAILDIAERAGLIDGASRPAWEKDFYIPFYRLMEDEGGTKGPVPTKGLVNQYAFKVLKGGERELGDPLENILKNWSHLIDASLKNQAAREALLAAQRVGAVIEADEATARQIAKAIDNKRGSVSFVDNGVQRWFVVEDPFLLDAVRSIGFTGFSGPAMKVMQKFKRWLTLGVTVSPTFRIRNVIRDSISMIGTNPASYNVLSNVLTGWKATKEGTPEYASLLAGGGVMRFGTYLEGDRAEHVKRLIAAGVEENTILDNPRKVRAMLTAAWDWWQHVGDRAENINRAALYKKLREQGMSHLEASFRARDVIDFSMQGTWAAVRFLTQTVPFMNARLQGLYKLGRGAKEDPRRFGIVLGATALASIALMLAYQDDDDWKSREDWDRETFWWFKIGDTAYRIPKPFEIGAIATLAERGLEAMISDELTGRQFAERVYSIVSEQLSLNPVPQLLKPIIELYANRDSFTDRPIESMGMERLSKPQRYGPGTSATAILLGKNGLVSPVQIDHLVRGYFGWLGSHVVSAADLALRPAAGMPPEPAWKVDDVLVVGDFARSLPSYSSKYVTRLYDQMKEVQEAMADLRHLQKIGAIEEAKELLEEKRDKIRLYRLYTHAEKQLAAVNRQIRMVQMRPGDAAEKRARLDALYAARNRIAKITEEAARRRQQ